MRNVPLFFCIGSLCFLTACDTTGPYGSSQTAQPGLDATYTNVPSQFQFPPLVASFQREEITKYDRQGQDVGVGYNDLVRGIAVTVFVYPIQQRPPNDTLAGHFVACKNEVLDQHSGAQLVSEDIIQISPGEVQRSGQHATFTYTDLFAHKRQPLRSQLFVFTLGSRFIMYRATYPVGRQQVAEPAIRIFIDVLAWPQ